MTQEELDEALLQRAGDIAKTTGKIAKAVGVGYVNGIKSGRVPAMLTGPKAMSALTFAATGGNPVAAFAVGYIKNGNKDSQIQTIFLFVYTHHL